MHISKRSYFLLAASRQEREEVLGEEWAGGGVGGDGGVQHVFGDVALRHLGFFFLFNCVLEIKTCLCVTVRADAVTHR